MSLRMSERKVEAATGETREGAVADKLAAWGDEVA
jgi:hypothetical protein